MKCKISNLLIAVKSRTSADGILKFLGITRYSFLITQFWKVWVNLCAHKVAQKKNQEYSDAREVLETQPLRQLHVSTHSSCKHTQTATISSAKHMCAR